jgi:phenylalanyl-tRNA synthetase beta chain
MLATYNWLKSYVDFDVSPQDLAHKLTMAGLEVEDLFHRYGYLDKVVVCRVTGVEDHPRSEKLKVCKVETGSESYQVVCGAPNVSEGMISALALVGAELPDGETVKEVDLRGFRSTGNLCSEFELLAGDDASGIISLPENTRLGTSMREVLGLEDWVIEIDITPNRPDCTNILGIAREVAGIVGAKVRYPEFNVEEADVGITDQASVEILDPDHCPRYVARVINGITIGPSPFWLVDRLAGVGVRSINNIVDITNYVLMEMGQPLHAFDLDRVAERRIVVKTAGEGERFITLDGEERIMGPEMLMICDGKKSVALAGVMGGLNSEIMPTTTDVLLESAYFNPVSIRRTAKTLGLSSEASFRFERGIDPTGCALAADRAAALMAELAGGKVAAGIIDVNPKPHRPVTVSFSYSRCNAFLGTDIEPDQMAKALSGIELEPRGDGDRVEVDIPPFRVDLTRDVDLYEEVARLVGYDEIPVSLPTKKGDAEPEDPSRRVRTEISETLQGLGLSEVINYSFISSDFREKLDLPGDDPRRSAVRIINPLSEEQALLQTTLVPGLLDSLRRNQSFQVMDLGLFEMGKVFFEQAGQDLPDEKFAVGGLLSGKRADITWSRKSDETDFYDIKGLVENLLESLNISNPVFTPDAVPAYYDQAVAASVSAKGLILGHLGKLSDQAADAFSLKAVPYIFELDLEALLEIRSETRSFQALPRFPAVSRDQALVLERSADAGQVLDFINDLNEELLVEVSVFDYYEGRQLKQGLKSLAFRFLYRSPDRTMTDEEVSGIHQNIIDQVLKAFKAEIR